MNGAGFFQFQGSLRCNRQGGTATQNIKRFGQGHTLHEGWPLQIACVKQALWQLMDRTLQVFISCPGRNQCCTCDERYDEGFCGRHTFLRSGIKWQTDIGGSGGWRILHVDDGNGQSSGSPCRLLQGDNIRTLAGLGNRHGKTVLHFQFGSINADDRSTDRGHRRTRQNLCQIFQIACRIV